MAIEQPQYENFGSGLIKGATQGLQQNFIDPEQERRKTKLQLALESAKIEQQLNARMAEQAQAAQLQGISPEQLTGLGGFIGAKMTPERASSLNQVFSGKQVPGHIASTALSSLAKEQAAQQSAPTSVDATAEAVINGQVALSQIPGFGKNSLKSQVLQKIIEKNPNFDLQGSETAFTRKQGNARFESGASAQLPIRVAQSVIPNIDQAVEYSNKVPRTSIQQINKLGIKGAAQFGNVDAQNLLAQNKIIADEFQSIIGRGSDKKLDLALDILDTAQSVEQYRSSAKILKDAINNRVKAFKGTLPEQGATPQQPQAPQFDFAAEDARRSALKGPKR